jgi:competence protein ComEC
LVQGVVVVGPKNVRTAENILDFNRQETSEWCLELRAVRNAGLWESVSGYARIFVDGEIQPLPVGSSVRVYGRATRPSTPLNPSEFDFQRHSQLKRVLTMVRVRSWSSVVFCGEQQAITLAGCIDWLHQRCLKRLHEIVPEDNLPLASSLLLGARDALPARTVNAFAETGSAHVLAISGLHIGLVATAAFYVLRLFGCSLRIGWLLVVAVITIYACLTGCAIPVVRATMLMWVAGLGVWTRRRFAGLHALAIVAIALLFWSPVSVVSVGTLLSFLATAVLISLGAWCRDHWSNNLITQLVRDKRGRTKRALYRFFDASCCFVLLSASVWIVSVPLVIVGFQRFVPIAIGTNILIAPLLPCVMASGLVCLVSVFLPVSVCEPLGDVTGLFFDLLERIVDMLASIPGSSVRVHTLPTWWVLSWYVVIVLFLLQVCNQAKLVKKLEVFGNETNPRGAGFLASKRKFQVFGVILFGVGMLGISLQLMPKTFHKNRLIVTAMGHGCGIVMKTKDGQCLVYDAGRIGASGAALRSLRAVLISEGNSHNTVSRFIARRYGSF